MDLNGDDDILGGVTPRVPPHPLHLFPGRHGLGSVLEGTAAAGSTYEIFEQVAIDLPESSSLGHLGQVIHTELKAELFQVLNDK